MVEKSQPVDQEETMTSWRDGNVYLERFTISHKMTVTSAHREIGYVKTAAGPLDSAAVLFLQKSC